MKSLYKKAYLFGSPISHSISPAMHNYSFDKLNINARYEAIDISLDNIASINQYIRDDYFLGANVTMPLKTEVIKLLDKLDITSQLSGSVNTIVKKDGLLYGYTTDGAGFINSLREIDIDIANKHILMLGAGGAARAIITQASLDKAASITIAKRINHGFKEIETFISKVTDETLIDINLIDITSDTSIKDAVDKCDIIINATPVGMTIQGSLIDKSYLTKDKVVCDLIYEPDMTKLLTDAKKSGCKYINGRYMLMYQGALSFKLWTDMDMPIEEVKKKYFS